ncbi:MAG: myxococcus cysteine-rich repeat containing protein [Candidatus ainarchaeum sp.]|nr:myxococcus cysteine-rich repeat containing protein [Candidatus ainarchaeum sp.]
MNVSSKGFISVFFVLLVLVSLAVLPNIGDNNSALLYLPFIDHNKMKTISTNTTKNIINPYSSDPTYITQKCSELQKEATKNTSIVQQISIGKNVCEEQDKASSMYEKGITVSYNPKEITMYKEDGSKYNLSKGCHSLEDSCTYNGSTTLIESYCDTTKQVVTSKEIKCPTGMICNKGACIKPSCGDGLLLSGEDCDDGNTINGDGCDSGCKIEKKPIDLYVGKIEKEAISKKCMNYFSFEICNSGPGAVAQGFNVLLKSEDSNVVIPIDIQKYGAINSNACILVDEPGYANIIGLKLNLGDSAKIEISVDYDNLIIEENENNNSKSETVFSGSAYMYDNTTECETSCYDSDGGWQYPASINKGTLFFNDLYELSTTEDSCSLFGIELTEKFCGTYSWNGKIESTSKEISVPCYLQNKKCEDGKCVDLESGESKNNLSCIETEDFGIFVGGDIIFGDFKGEIHNLDSSCLESILTYYQCDDLQPILSESDCWYDNALCIEGKCVPGEINFICDKKDTNYFKKDFAFAQKEIKVGEFVSPVDNKEIYDSCVEDYGSILQEAFCGKDNVEFIDYNCAEMGATCVDGECKLPDFNLKFCDDYDQGLNVFEGGSLFYWNEFDVHGTYNDTCVDKNQILELYCDGVDYKTTIINCKEFGEKYSCVDDFSNAFCGYPDESKEKCESFDNGVAYTNTYGITESFGNDCINFGTNDSPSYQEVTYFCNGNKKVKNHVDCADGQSCMNSEHKCKPLVEPECYSSDGNNLFIKGNIFYVDKFGNKESNNMDCCKPGTTQLQESYCDGTNIVKQEYDCKILLNNPGAVCYYGSDECKVYDLAKDYCKETEYGIEYGDGYKISEKHNICSDDIWSLKNIDDYFLGDYYYAYNCDENFGYDFTQSKAFGNNNICVYNFVDQNEMKVLNKVKMVSIGDYEINDYMLIYPFEGLNDYIEESGIFNLKSKPYGEYKTTIKNYLKENISGLISKVVTENNFIGLKTCLATENPAVVDCPSCYTDFGVTKQEYYEDIYNLLNDVKPEGIDVCVLPNE